MASDAVATSEEPSDLGVSAALHKSGLRAPVWIHVFEAFVIRQILTKETESEPLARLSINAREGRNGARQQYRYE